MNQSNIKTLGELKKSGSRSKTIFIIALGILLFLSVSFMAIRIATAVKEPEPLIVTTPNSVAVSEAPSYALVFFINNDNTIGYKISADRSNTDQILINPGNSENIQKVITDAEIEFNSLNKKMEIFIKGDNTTKYPQFKTLIDALKTKEIFKFHMITSA